MQRNLVLNTLFGLATLPVIVGLYALLANMIAVGVTQPLSIFPDHWSEPVQHSLRIYLAIYLLLPFVVVNVRVAKLFIASDREKWAVAITLLLAIVVAICLLWWSVLASWLVVLGYWCALFIWNVALE